MSGTEQLLGAVFVCGAAVGSRRDLRDQRLLLSIWGQQMPIVIDPDLREVGAEQSSLYGITGCRVEGPRPLEQIEVAEHRVGFLLDHLGRGRQPLRQCRALDLEIAEPVLHLAGGQGPVGGEIEQPFFLAVQRGKFLLDPCVRLSFHLEPLIEVRGHLFSHRRDRARRQLEPLHGAQDRIFDQRDGEIRQVAFVALFAHAEVVGIHLAVAIDRLGVDQLPGASLGMAASTVQHPAQDVVVGDIALGALHPGIEHLLHAFEDLRRHERLVATRVNLALVGHHPQIVGIAQNDPELTAGQWLLVPPSRAARGQTLLGELFLESREAVLAGGVLVEGPGHERRPLGIDVDGIDEVAIDVLADVQVADLGAAGSATALRLVEHLVLDVLAALPDLHLVHDIGDGFHRVGHVPLAELLLRRDQLDVHAGEDPLGDRGIGLVAEDA